MKKLELNVGFWVDVGWKDMGSWMRNFGMVARALLGGGRTWRKAKGEEIKPKELFIRS